MARAEPRRVLITGGAGFIGYHLACKLAAEGGLVTLADNFSRGRRDPALAELTRRPGVKVIEADLTDAAAYAALGQGYDEVYHLAGKLGVGYVTAEPYAALRGNALVTLRVLDWLAAGGGRKLLFASTSEVYAWTQGFHPLPYPTPEDVPLSITDVAEPRASYAGAKIFGELAVAHGCRAAGLPHAIVRYHNVYGPRMGNEHVVPQLLARLKAGENPLVVRSARHVRAFCYVGDAVAATVAAMRWTGSGTFNIGNDEEPVAIGELARRLAAAAGISARVEDAEADTRDPILRRCPDISRARAILGYRPKVALDQGLKLTHAWYAGQGRELQHA
jgi:UDP-glucose 4-epimerase/UDP-glucuronate decarboxylase